MAVADLTADLLRAFLHYDPETGAFTRRQATGTAKVGDFAGWVEPSGYIKINLLGRKYYAHRLAILYATGHWPNQDVDHINGIRGDNRLSNLRDVSDNINLQNLRSAKSGNQSGLLGAHFHKQTGKYVAEIKTPDGIRHYLGFFADAEDAHAAYLAAKRKLHDGCTI